MKINSVNLDKEKLEQIRRDLVIQGKDLYDDKERFYKLAFFTVGLISLSLLILLIVIATKKSNSCCDCDDFDDFDDYDYDYYELSDLDDDYASEEDFA
ncbi:MAG: hypothetical protein ACK5LY_08370 [Lachnospirales bacterium]